MASTDIPGKGYTPPKGRHTTAQDETDDKRRMSSTVEWAIAGVVLLVVLVVALLFALGSDRTTHLAQGPAPVVEPLVVDQI